jgi:hypothetical protein
LLIVVFFLFFCLFSSLSLPLPCSSRFYDSSVVCDSLALFVCFFTAAVAAALELTPQLRLLVKSVVMIVTLQKTCDLREEHIIIVHVDECGANLCSDLLHLV